MTMVESVVKCIDAQAEEMFKGGVTGVSYDETLDRVVVKIADNIAELKDTSIKSFFTNAVEKFIENHFPFLRIDNVKESEMWFTKTLWIK